MRKTHPRISGAGKRETGHTGFFRFFTARSSHLRLHFRKKVESLVVGRTLGDKIEKKERDVRFDFGIRRCLKAKVGLFRKPKSELLKRFQIVAKTVKMKKS